MIEKRNVLLSQSQFLDWVLLGKVLSFFHKIPLQDAALMAKKSWGVIGKNLSAAEAESLCSLLSASGLGGVIVEDHSFQVPGDPHSVKNISIEESGLRISINDAEDRVISWSYVGLMCLGVIKQSSYKSIRVVEGPSMAEKLTKAGILLATGIPLPTKKKTESLKKIEETELRYFLDLFLVGNNLRIHLEAVDLDYSFLGKNKEAGSQVNFRRMAAELAGRSKVALHNRGLRVVLNSQPINTIGYETLGDFEAECGWLLTLMHLNKS